MKYEPPEQGNYKDNLSADSLYNVVAQLFQKYHPDGQIKHKLWEDKKIRPEMEEYVRTYFFGGLEPNFEQIFFSDNTLKQLEHLISYRKKLAEESGSDKEAVGKIVNIYFTLLERFKHIKNENGLVIKVNGNRDILIKKNAQDGFAQILTEYSGKIEFLEYAIQDLQL